MTSAALQETRFRLSAERAEALVDAFGTPLYVIDETHFRNRIRAYFEAFRQAYPDSEIAYASKANSTLAVLAIASAEGCVIDVASEGELRAALAAGVKAERCHLHGNNKQLSELTFALDHGIGAVVVDHFGEIETVAALGARESKIVLRLAPGVDPVTHAKISTGQADTKFGFNLADGSAERATLRCLELGLPLIGFHCHVGSQLLDPEAQRSGGELIARFAREMRDRHGFSASYLNVGGGLGVMYRSEDRPMDLPSYNRLIVDAVMGALEGSGLAPRLAQEPGRALIAESGVTLYRVGVVKTVPARGRGTRTYAAVDGGVSDNPRPALYGARYTVERVLSAMPDAAPPEVEAAYTISGKHCETDMLFEDVELPGDLRVGDVLQVLCTGAYNASMASNYNRYPRPATALVRADGSHVLVQRRDAWEEMLARETVPEDLR
ncbi:MAG: diaminopimelate decarboxylase [Fimbriimonas sp.]